MARTMKERGSFSAGVLRDLISQDTSGWGESIPPEFLTEYFSTRFASEGASILGVNPAAESESGLGRGAPVFDAFNANLEGMAAAVSFKITSAGSDPRLPRNFPLTTGKPEHIASVVIAAESGKALPVWGLHLDQQGQWWRCRFDAAEIIRESELVLTATFAEYPALVTDFCARMGMDIRVAASGGQARPGYQKPGETGNPVTISLAVRKSGGRNLYYYTLRVNVLPAGLTWERVDAPSLPQSYADLLGEEDEILG